MENLRICNVLSVIGWISIVGGAILFLASTELSNGGSELISGLLGIVSGIIFFALRAMINILHRIQIAVTKE